MENADLGESEICADLWFDLTYKQYIFINLRQKFIPTVLFSTQMRGNPNIRGQEQCAILFFFSKQLTKIVRQKFQLCFRPKK